ncbi:cysteine-rich secretory protein 3-like [Ptychodera flava]|uniref:cysteine-rich secretory protein 3-like n=1 Tax=Ptychodera flava TaxID=63121 RepID=UPI003969F763
MLKIWMSTTLSRFLYGYLCLLPMLIPFIKGNSTGVRLQEQKSEAYDRILKRSAEEDLGPWIWPFTEDQINAIVDTHNDLRKIVEPEASDMMKMVWDEELSLLAQNWSEGCVFAHPSYPVDYGQNLATHSDLVRAINAWFSEYVFYDYDTMTCEPGKLCGHYTQVAWAASYQVGCGILDCGISHLTTCNYRPAGNSPGRQPYQSGHVCSQCPSPSWCEDRLCNPECKIEGRLNCDCTLMCLNCAETNHDECSCSCKPGWMGIDCVDECDDTHNYCGNGWYKFLCGEPGWEFVDDFCVKMCDHCDPGPYNPQEHCCEGLQCGTGLVDANTCECQCFDDSGDPYHCDPLISTTQQSNITETRGTEIGTYGTAGTPNHTPDVDPLPESVDYNFVAPIVLASCVTAYVILAACLTWKLYLKNTAVVLRNKVDV